MTQRSMFMHIAGQVGRRLFLALAGASLIVTAAAQSQVITKSRMWPKAGVPVTPVGDTLQLNWTDPGYPRTSYGTITTMDLGFDHQDLVADRAMDLRVSIKVTATINDDLGDYTPMADHDSIFTLTFRIGRRSQGIARADSVAPDSLLDRALDARDHQAYSCRNARKLKFELLSVQQNLGTGMVTLTDLPAGVYFDGRLRWSLVPELDVAMVPEMEGNTVLDCSNGNGRPDELEVSWSTVEGAYEYHLEWTWVDDYLSNGATGASPTSLRYDLRHNATRVSVPEPGTHYRIPLLFDHGYLIMRVRAMGRDPLHPERPVYGAWSLAEEGLVSAAQSADPLGVYAIGVAHRGALNWQLTSSFAEEGKRKEVMTYADGTLRSRETVTRNNSLGVPIIGETFYDAVGRAAIETMPVPLVKGKDCPAAQDDPIWAPIELYTDFNRADVGGEPREYTYADMVAEDDQCGGSATPFHPADGAELYYHPDHMDVTGSLTGDPPFLPQAQGYPFVQTEFTRDNTGRVRRKSGVGDSFKLGSGHETRALYGKPEQIKLDRLFGSEVGYASHYQKNVIIDGNGQASVSYLDGNGRTVATALAGGSPQGMVPVTTFSTPQDAPSYVTDMFGGLSNLECEQNVLDATVPSLVFTDQIVVPANQLEYAFDYTLSTPHVTDTCLEVCLTCVYDVSLQLFDQCGTVVLEAEYPQVGIYQEVGEEGTTLLFSPCGGSGMHPQSLPALDTVLDIGEYTLVKTLKLHTAARDAYVAEILAHGENYLDPACFTPLEDLISSYTAAVDTSDCYIDCGDCYAALGTLDEFLLAGRGTAEEYQLLYDQCDELCLKDSWCTVAYKAMLVDMSYGGQYATVEYDDAGEPVVTDRASVFYFLNNESSTLGQRAYQWDGETVFGHTYQGYLPDFPVDVALPLWRQPRLRREDGSYEFAYRDESNDRTTVLVLENDGAYEPPLVSTSSSVLFLNGAGELVTYPENLRDLKDFLDVMRPGFERSLLIYHPEYCYWLDCKGYAKKTRPEDPKTSDEFDNWMRGLSYVVAKNDAHLVADTLLDPTDRVRVFVTGGPGAYDPFGTNSTAYGTYATAFRNAFDNYLTYPGATFSMVEAAAIFTRCGPYPNSAPADPNCWNFGAGGAAYVPSVFPTTAALYEAEWETFKSLFFAEKYRYQKKLADSKVMQCDSCPGVNYCLGQGDDNAWRARLADTQDTLPMPTWSTGLPGWIQDNIEQALQFYGAPLHMTCQACSEGTSSWYVNKAPRFPDPAQFPGMDSSPADMAYQNFMTTGDCPLASAWLGLFAELAVGHHLDDAVDLSTTGAWSGVMVAQNGADAPVPGGAWAITSVSASDLEVTVTPTGGTACTIELHNTDPVLSTYVDPWNAIFTVVAIDAQAGGLFDLHVQYMDTDNVAHSAVVEGSICSTYDLITCNFPMVGTANELGEALQDLFSLLAGSPSGSDVLSSPSIGLSTPLWSTPTVGPSYQDLGPAYFTAQFGASADWTWSWNSGTRTFVLGTTAGTYPRYVIEVLGVIDPVGGFDLATDLPDVFAFQGLHSVGFNLFDVDVHGVAPGFLRMATLHCRITYEVSGTMAVDIPVGTYGYPPSDPCVGSPGGPGYDMTQDLFDLFVDVVNNTAFTTVTGYDLWESPAMTDELRQVLGPLLCSGWTGPADPCTALPHLLSSSPYPGYKGMAFGDSECFRIFQASLPLSTPMFFGPPMPYGPQDPEGFYHAMSVQMLNAAGTPVGQPYIVEVGCFDLVFCPCVAAPGGEPRPMAQATKASSAARAAVDLRKDRSEHDAGPHGRVEQRSEELSFCEQAYQSYLDAVAQVELAFPEDSLGFVLAAEELFTENQLCYCVQGYVSLLEHVIGIGSLTNALINDEGIWDIQAYCRGPEPPCDPVVIPPPTPSIPPPGGPSDCADLLLTNAINNAHHAYQDQLDELTRDLTNAYNTQCMRVLETLAMTYQDPEYHYTLYYYDQAGNLVKTIPPEGVVPMDIGSVPVAPAEQAIIDAIADDRANGTHDVLTEHRMPSEYMFNSLDHPIRQDMPDMDKMDIWETSLPNGLPADLSITGSCFTEGGRGYLTGNLPVPGQSYVVGCVYITDDGGTTWRPSTGIVGAHLNKVQFPTSQVGYAVGDQGTLLRTIDGGASWRTMPHFIGSLRDLLDVYFIDDLHGVVVGTRALMAYSADGGVTFTSASFLSGIDRATSVTYDGSKFYVAGITSTVGGTIPPQGFVRTATPAVSLASVTWAASLVTQGANTTDLTCASTFGTTNITVGGKNGTLLRSSDSGGAWSTVRTGTVDDLRDVYFRNANDAIALFDSSGHGVLRWSNNGGHTWMPAGHPSFDLNDFFLYEQDVTASKLVAVGKHGQVVRIVMGDGGVPQPVVMPAESDVELVRCWAHRNGTQLRFCAVGADRKMHWTRSLEEGVTDWRTPSAVLFAGAGPTTFALEAYEAATTINALVIRSDGTGVRTYVSLASDGPWTTTAIVTTDTRALTTSTTGHAILVRAAGGMIDVDMTVTSMPFTGFAAGTGAAWAFADQRAMVFLPGGYGTLFAAGAGGNLRKAVLGAALTATRSDVSALIKPLPLYDLANGGGRVVAGAGQGSVFVLNGGAWKVTSTKRLEDVWSVDFADPSTDLLLAGPGGKVHTVGLATPGILTDISLPMASDIQDAVAFGGKMYLTGTDGTVFFRPSLSADWQVLPYVAGDIRGVSTIPSTQEVIVVGEHALVHRLLGAQRMVIERVHAMTVRDVHFSDPLNGYVVGNNYYMRHTTDGGVTWKVIQPPSEILPVSYKNFQAVYSRAPGMASAVGNQCLHVLVNGDAWVLDEPPFTGAPSLTEVAVSPSGAIVMAGTSGVNGYLRRKPAGGTWDATPIYLAGEPVQAIWSWPVYNGKEDFLLGGAGGSVRLMQYDTGLGTFSTPSVRDTGMDASIDIQEFFFHDRIAGYAVGTGGMVIRTAKENPLGHASLRWSSPSINAEDGLLGQVNVNTTIATIGFSSRHNGFMGGTYNGTPSGYARVVHDESELYSQRFWYDELGRLILSQNTKQFGIAPKRYSYSLYDDLGRVVEAGEIRDADNGVRGIFGGDVHGQYKPDIITYAAHKAWITSSLERYEVVRTRYDEPLGDPSINAAFRAGQADNLRLRVAHTTYADRIPADGSMLTYQQATHYSYDIHGNVKELVQDAPQLGTDAGDPDQRFKAITYDYDLISGNVRQVDYQDGRPDQFHHRYTYDADDRIDRVETSRNGLLWKEDARYFYYPHGPLERMELGAHKVQGMDYAYTLQGWLKGINSDLLKPVNDMGRDAMVGSVNALVGRDAYGLSLGYYGDADYAPIDASRWSTVADRPIAPAVATTYGAGWNPLYNGNIAHTVNSLAPFGGFTGTTGETGQPLAMAYAYDQLNRLKKARGVLGLAPANTWASVTDPVADRYRSYYGYDANGNIDTTFRWDQAGVRYDHMFYTYQVNGQGRLLRNRLYHVQEDADPVNAIVNPTDDGFEDYPYSPAGALHVSDGSELINTTNNYGYDAIGNLTRDKVNKVQTVDWTVAGKVRSVLHDDGSGLADLRFDYGATGSRRMKTVLNGGVPALREHYVRDAQGNIMAIYRYDVESASLQVRERPIYGSRRLGVDGFAVELSGAPPYDPLLDPLGIVNYELTDHLGNVATTITDELIAVDEGGDDDYDHFQPSIATAQGYEPFGGLLPGRNYDRGPAPQVAPQAFVVDDDFEDGEVGGWTAQAGTLSIDAGATQRLKVVVDFFGGAQIFFPTIAGEEYRLRFDLDLGNTANVGLAVYSEAPYGSVATTPPTPNYTTGGTKEATFTATSELTRVKIFKGGAIPSDKYYFIDNVTIQGPKVLVAGGYRFGFQGQEKDDEIHGATGTSYAFEYRMHDARIGRFLSIDPLAAKYAYNSPYAFSENRVIDAVELEGREQLQFMQDLQAKWNYTVQQVQTAWDNTLEAVETALTYTDVNDATVIVTNATRDGEAINFDGTPATTMDKVFAYGGAVIPVVGGSAVKKIGEPVVGGLIKGGKKALQAAGALVPYKGFGGDIFVRPDLTTTVLGRYKGAIENLKTDGAFEAEGLNFLDLPDGTWTWEKNQAFLDDAIGRSDAIRLVSDPSDFRATNVWDGDVMTDELTTFGKEVEYLKSKGYEQDGSSMVKRD